MSDICTPEFNDQTRKMQDRVKELREQLKATQRDYTRMTQLDKQAASLKNVAGPYSRVKKPGTGEYGEPVKARQLEIDRLKRQAEELLAKGDRLNMSRAKKVMAISHNIQMAFILASKTVYEHLAFAVGGGHVGSLVADATRSVARHIPGVKGLAEQAPRYGTGLSWQAMKDRAQGLREAPRQAWNQVWNGASDRELPFSSTKHTDEFYNYLGTIADALKTPGALDKTLEVTRAIGGKVGGTHAAVKEFLTQPEFREEIGRQSRHLVKGMEKNGATTEQIAQFMNRESTQAMLSAKGVARAYTEKMQGKNVWNSSVDRWIGTLRNSNSTLANGLAWAFDMVEPIRKIGVNIADRQVSNLAGAFRALPDIFKKGEMTPERADQIMFNIGRQGVGATMVAVGMLYYTKMGGVPGTFKKKDQPKYKDSSGGEIKPGDSEFLPGSAFHGDVFGLLQIGASMAQVYQKEYGKENGAALALDALGRPTYNWFQRTIPYTDTARRISNTLDYGRGHGKYGNPWWEVLGNVTRSATVPGFLQRKAADDDPYKGFRTPHNIPQDIEMGIPGHGVPALGIPGRLDVPKH